MLGKISEIREEADGAIARVSLFDSVPQLLVDGLRAGVYGSSWRGRPIKSDTDFRAPRSAHNPEGIPETTRLEIKLTDIGPTPFAAYAGTTALVGNGIPARSLSRRRTLHSLRHERRPSRFITSFHSRVAERTTCRT